VQMEARKEYAGAQLTAGQFEFADYNANRELISKATNDADGNIIFPVREFNEAGTYEGILKEISTGGLGWETDVTEYPYEIVVSDDGHGQLIAQVSFLNGDPVFSNSYSTQGASIQLVATKKAEGSFLTAGQFAFTAYDSIGEVVSFATNSADGTITLPTRVFNEPGTYSGFIKETAGAWAGWEADGAQYPYTVVVTDDGSGFLHAEVSFPNGEPVFANTYKNPNPPKPPKPCPCPKCCCRWRRCCRSDGTVMFIYCCECNRRRCCRKREGR